MARKAEIIRRHRVAPINAAARGEVSGINAMTGVIYLSPYSKRGITTHRILLVSDIWQAQRRKEVTKVRIKIKVTGAQKHIIKLYGRFVPRLKCDGDSEVNN